MFALTLGLEEKLEVTTHAGHQVTGQHGASLALAAASRQIDHTLLVENYPGTAEVRLIKAHTKKGAELKVC